MVSNETMIARIQHLEDDLKQAELDIRQLRVEAEARERGYWRAGVIFLGGIATTLIGIIWSNLGTIFPGR